MGGCGSTSSLASDTKQKTESKAIDKLLTKAVEADGDVNKLLLLGTAFFCRQCS
jgi:hypothetical protein